MTKLTNSAPKQSGPAATPIMTTAEAVEQTSAAWEKQNNTLLWSVENQEKIIKNQELIIKLQEQEIATLKTEIEALKEKGYGQANNAPYYAQVEEYRLDWIRKGACVQLCSLPPDVIMEYKKRLSYHIVNDIIGCNDAVGWAKDLAELMRGYTTSKAFRMNRKEGNDIMFSIKLLIEMFEKMEDVESLRTSVKNDLFFTTYDYELNLIKADQAGIQARSEYLNKVNF